MARCAGSARSARESVSIRKRNFEVPTFIIIRKVFCTASRWLRRQVWPSHFRGHCSDNQAKQMVLPRRVPGILPDGSGTTGQSPARVVVAQGWHHSLIRSRNRANPCRPGRTTDRAAGHMQGSINSAGNMHGLTLLECRRAARHEENIGWHRHGRDPSKGQLRLTSIGFQKGEISDSSFRSGSSNRSSQ
jgi:hypothetical protein